MKEKDFLQKPKLVGMYCFAFFSNYPPPLTHKVLIIGNLAKKLYSIPYPVSYFVIVAYFSINFIYNACDLAGIVGSTPCVLNNLILITCP